MALIGVNGGLVGTRRSPSNSAASGLWTANEQVVLKRSGLWVLDFDAATYIAAVEAADCQSLEVGVKYAISDFVVGCKADGIWTAIKASCILAGARTLAGALVPLVGTAPTNNNFVSGDYNRETGLVGNESTKYLDSNRNNNAEPQNSKHLSVFCSSASTASAAGRTYIGISSSVAGSSWLHGASTSNNLSLRANTSTSLFDLPSSSSLTGFIGVARDNSSTSGYRYSGTTSSGSAASVSPGSESIKVFLGVSASSYSNARLAFYSIGESLDLALLDTRVTTLVNDIAAAIP